MRNALMHQRTNAPMFGLWCIVAFVHCCITAAPVAAQRKGAIDAHDLQGMWTNATITPFERPAALKDKAFLTAEEAQGIEQQSAERRAKADGTSRTGDVGSYNDFWSDSGTKVVGTRQT